MQTQTQTQNNDTNNLEQRDDELNRQMEKHPAEESIAVLVKDAHRRKRQLRLLTISVTLNIILTLGFGYPAYKTNQTASLAQSNKNAVIANCEVSNQSRADNRALWDFIFALPQDQPPTPEQQKRAEQFKGFVAKTFAERNCQAEINKQ